MRKSSLWADYKVAIFKTKSSGQFGALKRYCLNALGVCGSVGLWVRCITAYQVLMIEGLCADLNKYRAGLVLIIDGKNF